jgi:hypothetical protein
MAGVRWDAGLPQLAKAILSVELRRPVAGDVVRALAQLVGQGTGGSGRRLAQFLAEEALQFLILAQHGRGLARRGVETHQIEVGLVPQRVGAHRLASHLQGPLQFAVLLQSGHQLMQPVQVGLGQKPPLLENPWLVGARQQLTAIARQRTGEACGSVGGALAATGGVEGGSEVRHIRGERVGVQRNRAAGGDQEVAGGGVLVFQQLAQRVKRAPEAGAGGIQINLRPELVDQRVAGMGMLVVVGQVGKKDCRLLRREASNHPLRVLHPQLPQELDPPDCFHPGSWSRRRGSCL